MARILLINYEYPPLGGGGGNATSHIARAMARMGHRPYVLTAQQGDLPHVDFSEGVTLRRIAAARRLPDRCTVPEMVAFMLAASLAAPGLVRQWRIEAAVTFFTLPCGPVGWMTKRRNRIPYVVSLQGGDVPGFDPGRLSGYHAVTGAAIRALWRDANTVVANSDGLAALARREAPQQPVEVIPAGADVTGIAPKENYAPGGEIRLLFVGRLVRQKGLDVLIAALAKMQVQRDWRLILVGDGPEWPALAGEAARHGIAHRLELRGWVAKDDLPAIYRGGDIFVLPSRDEGMPNALLEAMAAGLPVVASSVAGSREAVVDGETGLLVPPEDADALAAAISRLILDQPKRAAMGRAGRARVASIFSWDIVTAAWLRVIERAVAEGPKP